ncbi:MULTISPECIES: tRNA 2-selenouridine(34) synthase MnmH [Comamonadaceae]|uniref:tRNA 2-selenouridine(34) synthase MnmH n=1 Tax=Comamonadaceae TaxID=80864 RepID=UPI000BD08B48|nr:MULTISPECIES: tRNA 2-selenouridine(34) synthase MnmH [Comamonadaceae]OYY39163.1 MAG: tRNA 2-selenouridine(34) synthase MnmH [Polaromonas sp. 35-63-35]OYZ22029.1 MAG: tRNA 2-selenouridine(34) synthase MnmH [Polaromonas sp. 16-63-31]OYZ80466.1 MAG: tRNA 2-selenouridine(34) synthase MnmH [Polaromonas sp. 24-63-21]OZA51530.1 MAG: tRNA 2-selenouridine(34) synthase MnmH [Polaromonas sp. 17-63-33]OZA90000.1 MAG: tRNA 2-selenouridine(34) synthase MnmH [Polaromonas sp. 39-63-25]
MSVDRITAQEALVRLADFSTIIDARSEGEYAEDHLPGAVNWPSLNDDERKIVGTSYKQISQFEAKKLGAALVAKNIAAHIQREVLDKPREWQPLVYCWRGGKRSGSLALILDQIGFKVTLVDGGYKAFRAALVADLPQLAARYSYQVVCGTTGSGKTRLLQALQAQGAQVLDLEALANHRSSVLGLIPGVPQPSQKAFDSLIWAALRSFDPARPVYIESESKKVGNVAVPEGLIAAMRAAPCLQLDLAEDERVALLLEDYDFFVRDIAFFCERLGALTEARGKDTVQDWQARARGGDVASVVRELLVRHYDPVYLQSMRRNFSHYETARVLAPRDHTAAAMAELAASMLAS